jgi:hypothetical protein
MEMDLRILADAVNEWFPTWEFNGKYLDFQDLLDWEVIKPEWGFAGRNVRTRPQATQPRTPACIPVPEPPQQQTTEQQETEPPQSAETEIGEGVVRFKAGNLPPGAE